MPIEIKELVVRATVNEQPNNAASGGGNSTVNGNSQNDADPTTVQVKKSVEAILDILKRKNER